MKTPHHHSMPWAVLLIAVLTLGLSAAAVAPPVSTAQAVPTFGQHVVQTAAAVETRKSSLTERQRRNLKFAQSITKKYGVTIVHADNRCTTSSRVLGCYTPARKYPLSISTLGLNQSRTKIRHIALHEVAHREIHRKCGTLIPRIVKNRIERVTDAYSVLLGAPQVKGLSYTSKDMTVAKKIRAKTCR